MIAANIEVSRPIVRVTAKPLTVPLARQNRISAVIRVVKFESRIAESALS